MYDDAVFILMGDSGIRMEGWNKYIGVVFKTTALLMLQYMVLQFYCKRLIDSSDAHWCVPLHPVPSHDALMMMANSGNDERCPFLASSCPFCFVLYSVRTVPYEWPFWLQHTSTVPYEEYRVLLLV